MAGWGVDPWSSDGWGGVSSVSGVTATAAVGVLTPTTSKAVSGNSASTSVGLVGLNHLAPLSSVLATSASNSVTTSRVIVLNAYGWGLSGWGVGAWGDQSGITGSTVATGALTYNAVQSISTVTATSAIGSVVQSQNITLSNTPSTGIAGTLAPEQEYIIGLSGAESTGAAGSLTPSSSVALNILGWGQSGWGNGEWGTQYGVTGAVTYVGDVTAVNPISGVSATGAVGSLTPNLFIGYGGWGELGWGELPWGFPVGANAGVVSSAATGYLGLMRSSIPNGISVTGNVNSPAVGTTKAVSGTTSTGNIDSVAPNQSILLQGPVASSSVGTLLSVILGDRTASLAGVEASGLSGTIFTATGQDLSGVSATEGTGSLTTHSGAAYAVIIRGNSQIIQTVGIVSSI